MNTDQQDIKKYNNYYLGTSAEICVLICLTLRTPRALCEINKLNQDQLYVHIVCVCLWLIQKTVSEKASKF